AAERAEKLAGEIARLRAGLAAVDAVELEKALAALDERHAHAVKAREQVETRLEAVLGERGHAEEALAAAAGGGEGATGALYRLRSVREHLELRRGAAEELLERVRAPRAPARDDSLAERAELAAERAAALERLLAEREGLPPAARALAEEGHRLALAAVEAEPGLERAVAAALGPAAAALVAGDAAAALDLLEQAQARGLGSLRVLVDRDPGELVAAYRVVAKEDLLASTVPAVTREGFGFDPARGGSARAAGLASELRGLAAAEAELRRETMEAGGAVSALEVERARLEAELRDARRRLAEARAEPLEGERAELADRLERLERRR